MVTIFGISITVLFVWAIFRRMYLEIISRRFRYKLFELRDRLRLLAIDKKIDEDSWVFNYYDNSISKTISDYYYITFFRLIGSAFKFKGDSDFEKFSKKLEQEVMKNDQIRSIVDEYYEAVGRYIINQHYISFTYFIGPILAPVFGMKNILRSFKIWSNTVINTPELSDSGKYLHRA